MKKILGYIVVIILLVFIVLKFLCYGLLSVGCVACMFLNNEASLDEVVSSLPEYSYEDSYSCGVFQDFTFYIKYYYDDVQSTDLDNNVYLKKVTKGDIKEILSYVENFEEWVALYEEDEYGDIYQNYDFSKNIVEHGDYFYIEDEYKYDEEWKYSSYDIYYFDVESQILYYLHNNI